MGEKITLEDGATLEWVDEPKKKESPAKRIKSSGGLAGHVTIYYVETPDSSTNFKEKGFYVECKCGLNGKVEIVHTKNLLGASKVFNEYYQMLSAPVTIEN